MARVKVGLGRRLVTPEGVALNLRLAGAGARAGAFIIDALLMLGILIGVTLALLAFHTGFGGSIGNVMLILWLLGFFFLRNFYFILGESGGRAATLGKRVMKLRVVARDGGRLTGGAIVARNLMREIEVFLPLTFLAFSGSRGLADQWTAGFGLAWTAIFLFFPLFNRDRLRAGDLIAGTWVIEAERRKIGSDLMRGEAAHAIDFSAEELEVYGQYELHRLEDVLRRDDAAAMAAVADTIRAKLGRYDVPGDRAFLDAYYRALRRHLERRLLFGQRKRDKFDAA
ncbi:RDD family protein [Sphingomonas sp. Y38-1Y]|uniref:RDD family protein n=1 Tax=Sphingomonas sp. Y38-1Y TaxID=3078265 RepID=UPI0028E85C72|nr:RDD family protein [Sphingomonas sp. Y38-1Y]